MRAGPLFFATARSFRAWLTKNSARQPALLVGFRTVGSGKPSMTWPESVDEALCVGWIDGLRKRVDEHSYQIRFTPRRPGSIWSAINIAKAKALIATGRMKPAGLAAFGNRIEHKSRIYSYEQEQKARLRPGETRAFRKNTAAWDYFEKAPPGYRRMVLHWISFAKKEETRSRRLGKLIGACAAGRRLMP